MGLWDGRLQTVAAYYFIRVRLECNTVLPEYIWVFFNTPFMKQRLLETARGAIGQANINSKELRAFAVPLPSLELQRRFQNQLHLLGAISRRQAKAEQREEMAFASLTARLLRTGNVEAAPLEFVTQTNQDRAIASRPDSIPKQ